MTRRDQVRIVFQLLSVFVVLSATLVVSTAADAALTLGEFSAERHQRFANDDDFIGDDYDWSGVGRASDGTNALTNWTTMISNSYFITARHNSPGAFTVLKFFATNDYDETDSNNFWQGTVRSLTPIANTDLQVGRVLDDNDEPPPAWVQRYPLLKRQDKTNWATYLDPTIYVFGLPDGTDGVTDLPTGAGMRVGLNEVHTMGINSTVNFNFGTIIKPIYGYDYDPEAGFGDDEAHGNGGDSGAPSFAIVHGRPALLGLHLSSYTDWAMTGNLSAIVSAVEDESISIKTDLLGDLNLDFRVNSSDSAILGGFYNTGPGSIYSEGDLNGDGYVNVNDAGILATHSGETLFAPADFNQDQKVDASDFALIATNWNTEVDEGTNGDADGDEDVDIDDVVIFGANFNYALDLTFPAPAVRVAGDANGDGAVDGVDGTLVSNNYNTGGHTPYTNGDLDGDGDVDIDDAGIYSTNQFESFADINNDQLVNTSDAAILAENWHEYVVGKRSDGDLNENGYVDSTDLDLLGDWWGFYLGSGHAPTTSYAPIPESSTTALTTLAMLIAVGVCRRRN